MNEKFPVNDYFADSIIDGTTVAQSARRWVAILQMRNPQTGRVFSRVYNWKKNKEGEWKRAAAISFYKSAEVRRAIKSLESMMQILVEDEAKSLTARMKNKREKILKKS